MLKKNELTSIIGVEQLFKCKLYTVLQICKWKLLVALSADHPWNCVLITANNAWEIVILVAMWTHNFQLRSGSVLQVLKSFSFQNCAWHHRILLLVLVILFRVLMLFQIYSEALRYKIYLNSFDMLNQACERRHKLLWGVPVDIYLERALAVQ